MVEVTVTKLNAREQEQVLPMAKWENNQLGQDWGYQEVQDLIPSTQQVNDYCLYIILSLINCLEF